MSASNIIAIVGSTGTQGRSVAKAFLAKPDWHVRCISRNPSSTAAQSLTASGAEVIHADLTDPDSLSGAFAGAHAIFVNTDFWAPYSAATSAGKSPERATEIGFEVELSHAKNAADAAAKVLTLRRFVYSALGPMKAASEGKYPHSGHWDSKAAAADYIEKERPELVGKVSFIYPAAYHTNPFTLPQNYPHLGVRALMLPGPSSTAIPIIEMTNSFGLFVRALVVDEHPGVKLFAYDCNLTAKDLVDTWNKVTGKNAKFVEESLERMHNITGLPYEVLDGPAFLGEFHYMAGVEGDVIEPKDLKNKVETRTFEEILRERATDELHGSRFPNM